MRRDEMMRRLRQPASAAVAGIVFAVILGAVIVLLRNAAPALDSDAGRWADDAGRRGAVDLALSLIPFAGMAFLWFIGVLRAQVGAAEDRFVGTVFLGSGLLFVAMLFTAAASLKAVLSLQDAGVVLPDETRAWGWAMGASLLGLFGVRMAAVFVASVATVGRRAGAFPRWLAGSGYVVALLLLVTPPLPAVGQLLFPTWILVLSGYLLTGRHTPSAA
jgi:hypothetical protein